MDEAGWAKALGITADHMDEIRLELKRELLVGCSPERAAELYKVPVQLVHDLFPGGRVALLREIRARWTKRLGVTDERMDEIHSALTRELLADGNPQHVADTCRVPVQLV